MICLACYDTGFVADNNSASGLSECRVCNRYCDISSPSHRRLDNASSPPLQPTTRLALKNHTYMAVAVAISTLSTCRRLQVGCVLLGEDGRVLGTGYNGALPGRQHCDDETCGPGKRCLRTRHAERSALDYSLGAVAKCYVTHEPCVRCTQDLIARGCREVYYLHAYVGADDEKTWRQRHVDEAGVKWTQMRRDDSDGTKPFFSLELK